MAFSSLWNSMTSRPLSPPSTLDRRLAPTCRGHEETMSLTASNAAADVERLLEAIRLAGGAVQTAAKGAQEPASGSPNQTSDQQVGSAAPQAQGPAQQQQSSAATFPRFAELAKELREMVWGHALNEPRLIYVHLGVPGTVAGVAFNRSIMNRTYLVETDPLPRLFNTCRESRHEVHRLRRMDATTSRWLNVLGLDQQFRPARLDLVYLGGLWARGQYRPADTNRIIPLSLVLGKVLPRVCVNADVFVDYFNPGPDQQPENPIAKALADLRMLGIRYAALLADSPTGLPQPRLPERMVFMLDNFRLRWLIASPCTIRRHENEPVTSCCIHYSHLDIVADEDMDRWMDVNMAWYNDNLVGDRLNWRIRREIVPSIRAIWSGWRNRPDVASQVPRLFFARIKHSH